MACYNLITYSQEVLELPHPFKDKIFVVIGRLKRCSKLELKDKLAEMNSYINSSVSTLADYFIVVPGSEVTQTYHKAHELSAFGGASILTEEQFFDILEGKSEAPRVISPEGVLNLSADNDIYHKKRYLEKQRVKYLSCDGVPTEIGRVKIDVRVVRAWKIISDMRKGREH